VIDAKKNKVVLGDYEQNSKKIRINVKRDKDFSVMGEQFIFKILNEYQKPNFFEQAHFFDKHLFLRTLTHEATHLASHQSFHITKEESKKHSAYRGGYENNNNLNEDYPHTHFWGFNEAVVEHTAQNILHENSLLLNAKFNINVAINIGNSKKLQGSYKAQRKVLQNIIYGVAEAQKISPTKVWEKIEKGQFTGEMMHLREIEKVYGSGSLRILASMDASAPTEETKEKYQNYVDYFDISNNLEERKVIADKILKGLHEEEQKAYKNHLEKMEDKTLKKQD